MRLLFAVVMASSGLAYADDVPVADITAQKSNLGIVTDGKGHYLVFSSVYQSSAPGPTLFYGDGKTFWALHESSSGGESDAQGKWKKYSVQWWEPRAGRIKQGGWVTRGAHDFEFKEGKYTVSCVDRKTEMKLVSDEETRALLDGAKFFKGRWSREPYALARDDTGRYFYVDRPLRPPLNKNFRLWAGPKGALKVQKMTNVVSDSEGDIFATKTGSLRLILDKKQVAWVQGKKSTPLTILPLDDNEGLIYDELGVYAGQPIGTPCDDL